MMICFLVIFCLLCNVIDILLFKEMKRSIKVEKHYSPVKLIKKYQEENKERKGSCQFIPFSNQRDGLGRLIAHRPQKIKVEKIDKKIFEFDQLSPKLQHADTAETNQIDFLKTNHVDQAINRSFKFHEIKQSKPIEYIKLRTRKNSLPTISYKLPCQKLKATKQLQVPVQGIRKRYGSVDFTQNCQQKDLLSPILPTKTNFNRKFSEAQITQNSSMSPPRSIKKIISQTIEKKTGQDTIIRKRSESKIMIPLIISEKNIQRQNIFELNSYNISQKLSFKLKDDLENGHKKFIDKMLATKQLAYKIKLNIQNF